MRRMYSQAELAQIIKDVFLADVASGQIDLPDLIEQALPDVDPAGLDFTGVDFVAKTLKQTQSNYSLDLKQAFESGNYSTYFKSDTAFMRFEEINGVLWLIMSGRFVAQAVSGTNASFNLTIPNEFKEKYYNKIYRMDGTPLTEEQDSTSDISNYGSSN